MKLSVCLFSVLMILMSSCSSQEIDTKPMEIESAIRPGIYNLQALIEVVKGKKIAIVANNTSYLGTTHLVDTLLSRRMDIEKVFAPEHGFRGNKSDGATIEDFVDQKTGLQVASLYGANKKPSKESLKEIEVIVFDIQDVGARFYTYLSTLHYVMEAAAENKIPVVVLDRPNPNIHYVDGPIMDSCCTSFVGLHPVPIVYGMTIGEYAQMINGEEWLKNKVKCDLTVIPCENYTHHSIYNLPIPPSPNLPNMTSVYLYPSLCLFEGTTVSIGRGTDRPFTMIGEPGNNRGSFTFTPESRPGFSLYPKHQDQECIGYDLYNDIDISVPPKELDFSWVLLMYEQSTSKTTFFNKNGYFNKLAGNEILKEQIESGLSLEEISLSWQEGLKDFKEIREKYLIYPE